MCIALRTTFSDLFFSISRIIQNLIKTIFFCLKLSLRESDKRES